MKTIILKCFINNIEISDNSDREDCIEKISNEEISNKERHWVEEKCLEADIKIFWGKKRKKKKHNYHCECFSLNMVGIIYFSFVKACEEISIFLLNCPRQPHLHNLVSIYFDRPQLSRQ